MLNRLLVLTLIFFFFLFASSFPEPTSAYPRYPRYRRYRRFNISNFIYPRHSDNIPKDNLHYLPALPSPFFKDVVKAIGKKEKWDSKEEVKISQFDWKNFRSGASQRYEFRSGTGQQEVVFKLMNQVSPWSRLAVKRQSDFEALVKKSSSNALLDSFEIHGPFHLTVIGDHNLTLSLPLDASFSGLKHVLVGEGITVEVSGATEVSLLHGKDTPKFVDTRLSEHLRPSICMAQLPVRIQGSAVLVAYRTHDPNASIRTRYLSKRTVELLPAKCYSIHAYRSWGSSINFVKRRIPLLEKVMRKFFGQKTNQNPGLGSGSLHAKLIASSMFRFKLELQREIKSNDSKWNTLADWRTKPSTERFWFEVIVRADGEVLKLVQVNKLKSSDERGFRYLINLRTNMSFTKFPALILPQKSLTLDVNWWRMAFVPYKTFAKTTKLEESETSLSLSSQPLSYHKNL